MAAGEAAVGVARGLPALCRCVQASADECSSVQRVLLEALARDSRRVRRRGDCEPTD